jgi:LmbE family N-acetylglucosaminyl deacetylase
MARPWILSLLLAALSLPACDREIGPKDFPVLEPPGLGDRLLIVAPHIDDETLAAAGYAAAGLRRGAEVSVVYVTAGDCNRTSADIMDFTLRPGTKGFLQEGRRRIQEALSAMSRLGLKRGQLYFLGYPDRGILPMLDNPGAVVRSIGTGRTAVPYEEAVSPGALYRLASLEKDLRTVFDQVQPTAVVLPVSFDAHPDHSASGRITLRVLGRTVATPRRLGYLIHSFHYPEPFLLAPGHPLLPPRRFLEEKWTVFPLNPADEQAKKRVIEDYKSQRRDPYLFVLTDAFIRKNELFLRM